MDLQNKTRGQLIIASLINCLAIFLALLLYSLEIKVKPSIVIGIIILLLILNIITLIANIKENRYINIIEDKLQLLEEILEAAPNAVYVHRNLEFKYLNKKAAEIFGVESTKEFIGKPVEYFVRLNMDEIGEERYAAARAGKSVEPFAAQRFFRQSGEMIELEIFNIPIVVKGNNYVLVLCKNVTEQKKILELEEKVNEEERKLREKIEHDRMKDEFFANLSHELRTPLTIILGAIQLLENTSQAIVPKENKNFKTLKHNGYRLLRLINNLLDITKIDSGYFEIALDKYNIVTVVEDITSSVVDYIENKGLSIEFDTEVEEKIVNCHLDSMDRIILNLLSNAVKFTPEGGRIFVNIYDEADNVKIVVRDTGIGIEKENINYIFDRFRQVDKSFTRNHEGSGIGLSIVKSLVEMQGGTISLNSEYGQGSEFIIKLPAVNLSLDESLNTIKEKEDYIEQKISIEFSDI